MVELVFYLFATLLLLSAVCVITMHNTVHAVLLLIFAFFNAAALFILIGAEYIAMTIVIVYVGAVAVLFLFVVMMLDLSTSRMKKKIMAAIPITLILGVLVFLEISIAMQQSAEYLILSPIDEVQSASNMTNTESIGMALYTDYVLQFQLAGLILLVAMIGAIMLTMRHSKPVKKQQVMKQVMRKQTEAMELIDVEIGKGVKLS